MKKTVLSCFEANKNHVYNCNFLLPNNCRNVPDGWLICANEGYARFCWHKSCRSKSSVTIQNTCPQFSSICQERPYYIPVNAQEEWQVGAVLKANRKMRASIIVHMINSCGQISSFEMIFMLQPGCRYYYRHITIPDDMQLAFLEIGTAELKILSIRGVVFRKDESKINVGVVEAVKKIIEPVKIDRYICDTSEDVIATMIEQVSETKNVLLLRNYTFSVLNLGSMPALVRLQSSPDGIHFMDEPMGDEIIAPDEVKAYTYNYFLPFVRICFKTETGSTHLRVFFHGHD